MRAIVTVLTIATELERIADHGKKITRICQRTAREARFIPLEPIGRLGKMALAMLDTARYYVNMNALKLFRDLGVKLAAPTPINYTEGSRFAVAVQDRPDALTNS